MKKILFVIPEYSHGGTNKSLENLLLFLNKKMYDVSIFCLYEDGGDYYKKVFAPFILRKSKLYYWIHDNVYTRKIIGFYNKVTKRENFTLLYKREVRHLEKKHNFDIVIAYQEGTATEFVSYFKNKNKIAWIHFDYAMLEGIVNLKERKVYYDRFKHIVCVSKAALESMLKVHPEYKDRSTYIYNTLNSASVVEASLKNMQIPFESTCFNIISIGRLVSIKQFQEIPKIVSNIKKHTNRPFCWYIIGSGSCEQWIRSEIEKYNVQDTVVLLGPKDNPYPFIHQANLLVCTSVAESFSYVIAEGKILQTPVLSNDFPVAYEVVDKTMGWIANIKDMPQELARIIGNEDDEYTRKKETAMNFEYSNEQILHKIDQLLQN